MLATLVRIDACCSGCSRFAPRFRARMRWSQRWSSTMTSGEPPFRDTPASVATCSKTRSTKGSLKWSSGWFTTRTDRKEFEVESSSGWGGARKHVFPRLLEAESEASRPGSPENSRITPQNYSFAMLRVDQVEGRKDVRNRSHSEEAKEISDARDHLGGRGRFRDRAHGR